LENPLAAFIRWSKKVLIIHRVERMEHYIKWLVARRWQVITILAMFLFAYAMVSQVIPSSLELVRIFHTLRDNRQKLADAARWPRMANAVKHKNEKIKTEISQLVFSKEQDSQVSNIVAFLSQAAKAHDVGILTFKPQMIKTHPRHVELPIQLEMTAHFHAMGQFINTLETAPAVIKLERLQMASKAMASNRLHVQMTTVVYYVAPAASSVKAANGVFLK
jgi:Tfp pilus assembly protein PilO